mgnify:FL=1
MAENKIIIVDQVVKINDGGENLPAVTAVVEGNFKNILDHIIANDENYTKYAEVVSDALFLGIVAILHDIHDEGEADSE